MEGRRRDNLPLILAIIAVVGVAAIGAYLLGSSGSNSDGGRRAEVRTQVTVVKEGTPRRRKRRTAPTGAQRLGDWPAGKSAYTVVLASTPERPTAEVSARRATGIAGTPGVLHSSDFQSLRPGYWVAFGGAYETQSAATAAATTFHSAGFSDAYVRWVSQRSEPSNAPPSGAGGWPAQAPGYTVVLASEPSQAGAEAAASRARSAGLPGVGVLRSADYSSLRPGYWVAYTGHYSSSGAAGGAIGQARRAGFTDAYTRRVAK